MSLLERAEEYKNAGLDVKEAAREDMKREREEREREREREERKRERQFELEKLRRQRSPEGFRFVPTTTTIHTTASTDF